MSSPPWYLAHFESICSRIERDRDAFFPKSVRRLDFLEGFVDGFCDARAATDLPKAQEIREPITRRNFSVFVSRHYNELHGAHRWGAGHGWGTVLRAESNDDDDAVTKFIELVRLWRAHQNI